MTNIEPRLFPAYDAFRRAAVLKRRHFITLLRYSNLYGTDGPMLSGGAHDFWPACAKQHIRDLINEYNSLDEMGLLLRPSRMRMHTFLAFRNKIYSVYI